MIIGILWTVSLLKVMKFKKTVALIVMFIGSITCFANQYPNLSDRPNIQYSVNYCRLGDIDLNGMLASVSLNWERKYSRFSININSLSGKHLRKNEFLLLLNDKTYSDYLNQQSSIYANALYSIRPINSKVLALYFGLGPSYGYYATNYYQFWYKENDVDPYILLMGEYFDGFTFGYTVKMQAYLHFIKRGTFFINTGFDAFFKYQSSIYYLGLGVVFD